MKDGRNVLLVFTVCEEFGRRDEVVGKNLSLRSFSHKGCFISQNADESLVNCADKSENKLLCIPGLFKGSSQSVSFITYDNHYILRHLGLF